MAFDTNEPKFVPASSVVNQSMVHSPLPARLESPTDFMMMVQPEGHRELTATQVGRPDDARSRRLTRDMEAFQEGGNNFGTIVTNTVRGALFGEDNFLDAMAGRGEDHYIDIILSPDDEFMASSFLAQDESIVTTRAKRERLSTLIDLVASPTFDGGSYYDTMREQNPMAFRRLESLGYTRDEFTSVRSATEFNHRMMFPLIRDRVRRHRDTDPAMSGIKAWLKDFGVRHFVEDPLSLGLMIAPLAVPRLTQGAAKAGGMLLRQGTKVSSAYARVPINFTGHTLMGGARSVHALHHETAKRIGYMATWGLELGATGGVIDALEQMQSNERLNRILAEMPEKEREFDYGRLAAAFGLSGALGGAIGGMTFGVMPRNATVSARHAFADFMTGGQMSLRRSWTPPGGEKIALIAGDDTLNARIYERARQLTGEDVNDVDLAFLLDEKTLGSVGGDKGIAMLFLDMVAEAIPEGGRGRVSKHALRETWSDWTSQYRQIYQAAPDKHSMTGVRYDALRKNLEERTLRIQQGETGNAPITRAMRRYLRENAELAEAINRRSLPGTAEWDSRLHQGAMALLGNQELRRAQRAVRDAMDPPVQRTDRVMTDRDMQVNFDPWAIPRARNTQVPVDQLHPLPDLQVNPARVGFYRDRVDQIHRRPIEVERLADGTLRVTDGNHRLAAAVAEGIEDVPIVIRKSAPEPPVERLYERTARTDVASEAHTANRMARQKVSEIRSRPVTPEEMQRLREGKLDNPRDYALGMQRAFGFDDAEREVIETVIDRHARAWADTYGESVGDYFNRFWDMPVAGDAGTHAMATIEVAMDSHRLLIQSNAFKENPASLRTALHEMAHGFSTFMPNSDRFTMNRWARRQAKRILDKNRTPEGLAKLHRQSAVIDNPDGTQRIGTMLEALENLSEMADVDLQRMANQGMWGNTTLAEEMLADGFTLWMRTGRSTNQEMEGIFQRFKYYLRKMFDKTYAWTRLSRYDLEIESDMDRIFASWFNAADAPDSAVAAVARRADLEDLRVNRTMMSDLEDSVQRQSLTEQASSEAKLRKRLTGKDAPPHLKARIKNFEEELALIRDRVERGMGTLDDEQRGLAIVLAMEEAGIPARIPQPRARLRPDGTKANNITEFTGKTWNPATESGKNLKRLITQTQSEESLTQRLENVGRNVDETPDELTRAREQQLKAQQARNEAFERLSREREEEIIARQAEKATESGGEAGRAAESAARGIRIERMAEDLESLPEEEGRPVSEFTQQGSILRTLGLGNMLSRLTTSRTGAYITLQSVAKSIRYAGDMLDVNLTKAERLSKTGGEAIDSTFQDGQNQALRQIFEPLSSHVNNLRNRGVIKRTRDYKEFYRKVHEHNYGVRISEDPDVVNFVERARKVFRELGEEGVENGSVTSILDNFLPQRWNPQAVSRNRDGFINKLTENWTRRWRDSDEIYNDALVDMGWARRVEDTQSNSVEWLPTENLPEEFGGVLPTTRAQLGEAHSSTYLSALEGTLEGVEKSAARRSAERATQRILSQDNYRVDSQGAAVRHTGYGVQSTAERQIGLTPEDLSDGVLIDFLDMDILRNAEFYARTTGTQIKAHTIVQRTVPGAVKGQTTPEEFFEAARLAAERFYSRENMDTGELSRAFAAINGKYQHMIGRAPILISETDTVGEWAAQMGREGAGLMWNAGTAFLVASTEMIRTVFGKAHNAADIVDNFRELVTGGFVAGRGAKARHRERLLDWGTAASLWRSSGYARFMGETHVSPMSMSVWDRITQPWKDMGESLTAPHLRLPQKLAQSSVLATRALNQNLASVSSLNELGNRLKSVRIYASQRELGTYWPAAERLSRMLQQEDMQALRRSARDQAIADGKTAARAEDLADRAQAKRFKAMAREAGFGSEHHVAQQMQQAKLLEPDVLPLIRQFAEDTGARLGTSPGSLTNRPFMDVVTMRQRSIDVPPEQAHRAKLAMERLDNYVERDIRRFMNEPSPWTSATDVASRTHWGRVHNAFLTFAMGAVVNIGMSSNQMPQHRALGMLLTYSLFDYSGQVARRIARGESMDSVMEEWEDDPETQLIRIFSRWPGWGLYSNTAGAILAHATGTGGGLMSGSAGQTAATQLMEGALGVASVPSSIVKGEDTEETFGFARDMAYKMLPGLGLMDRAVTGEWPQDASRQTGGGRGPTGDVSNARDTYERLKRGFRQDDREWPEGTGDDQPVEHESFSEFWRSVIEQR